MTRGGDGPGSDGDEQWEFSVDDVGPDGVVEGSGGEAVEPEEIDLEHAAFVLLGVGIAVGVLVTAL